MKANHGDLLSGHGGGAAVKRKACRGGVEESRGKFLGNQGGSAKKKVGRHREKMI